MTRTIFISGGGTGGHIYPALAIAKQIEKIDSKLKIRFIGTKQGLESEIIPKEGYALDLIQVDKLNYKGHFLKKIISILKMPWALIGCAYLIFKYQPQAVLGVGGYASGPMVLMAALMGKQTFIWEANAHPGLANRILSKWVNQVFVVFDEAAQFLGPEKSKKYGMPVRSEIQFQEVKMIDSQMADPQIADPQSVNSQSKNSQIESNNQKSKAAPFKILIFGGSQGSRVINHAVYDFVTQVGVQTQDFHLVHQIGKTDWEVMSLKYKDYLSWVTPLPFIYDMPKYYKWADMAICRGGASTLAEVSAFGLVPIVVPLPLADGHQLKNAQSFVQNKAAFLINQNELSGDRLKIDIQKIVTNTSLIIEMRDNLKKLFIPDAASKIAQDILNAINSEGSL